LLFLNRVSIFGLHGRYLYTVPGEHAKSLIDGGLARVSMMRRKFVMSLELLPSGLEMIGAAKGTAAGGGRYAVQERLSNGDVHTGHMVYRHRDEAILAYPDAFVDVVKGLGARVTKDEDADRRRTCLTDDQRAMNATRE
jgi:hypothetical protein